jgi:dolichol-phosphate mannosyltransferase
MGLQVKEVGVPRVYLDPNRAFGGMLNDAEERLAYYRRVLDAAARDWDAAHLSSGCQFWSCSEICR